MKDRDYSQGYNVDYPDWYELNEEERAEVVRKLLKREKLVIWRDRTPYYTDIQLVRDPQESE